MIDGYAGGNGGLDLVLIVGEILDVEIGGHGGQRDDRVQYVVDAAHEESGILGENVMGEAIEEAHDDQNQRIGHHDDFVTQLVDELAHCGGGEEAGNGGESEEEADGGSAGSVEEDQNIGAEGEEDLLAGAVEHFQHIKFGVLPVEVKAAFGFVSLAAAANAQREDHADTCQHGGDGEEGGVGLRCGEKGEGGHNDQIARQRANLIGGVLDAKGCAAVAGFGVLEGEGALHADLHVLAQRIGEDGQRGQHLGGREGGVHGHAHQHDDCAGLIQRLCGEHVKSGQNENQGDAGQLAEEFCDTAAYLTHLNHFSQKIVQHSLVKTVGQTCDQHREQEKLIGRIFEENFFERFVSEHNGAPLKRWIQENYTRLNEKNKRP